jgi:hypothetical protein
MIKADCNVFRVEVFRFIAENIHDPLQSFFALGKLSLEINSEVTYKFVYYL